MARKANREWATRSEAIAVLAESKNASGADVLAKLYNSTASDMLKAADALQAGILARKQAELVKLQAEVAAASKSQIAKQA